MAKDLIAYLRKNWIIYSLLCFYTVLLFLKAFGLETWLPHCPVTLVTGHNCFGCGLNTAAIYIISFNFKMAFEANPLIFLYVPVILAVVIYDFYKFKVEHKQRPK